MEETRTSMLEGCMQRGSPKTFLSIKQKRKEVRKTFGKKKGLSCNAHNRSKEA
jgi:hypothetical protein